MSSHAPPGSDVGGHQVEPAPVENPPGHRYRSSTRKRILRSLGILALALVLVSGSVFAYARIRLGRHEVTPCPSCRAGHVAGPMNVLVMGSDSRAGLSQQDLQYFDPTGQDRNSGQRADTIAILHIDFKTSKAVLINIPRDLRVKAPSGQFVKINSFYNQGPSAVVQAVTAFTGLPIDHYVEINFAGFRSIVDTLGGVRVRFSQAVNDPDSGLNVPAGCVSLTGNQALAFVRVRHIDSDFGRIARQQFFVQLLMSKIMSAGTLLNPFRVVQLVDTGARNVKTDTELGVPTMEKLGLQLRSFSPKDLDFRVVPSSPQSINGTSYVVPYVGQSAALFDALRTGLPLPDYGKQGTDLTPAGVRTTILNGTTNAGALAQAQAQLKGAGYPVIATGNTPSTGSTSTTIYYTPGNVDKATLLAQTFGNTAVQPLPAHIQAGGDAVVVLGQDYASTKATAAPSSSPPPILPAGLPQPIPTSALKVAAC
jgi:LCP family protein required for cell wall assembly